MHEPVIFRDRIDVSEKVPDPSWDTCRSLPFLFSCYPLSRKS